MNKWEEKAKEGVRRTRGKFEARICHNKKTFYLGVFDTAGEAAKAYNSAAIKFYGEFACLNPL